MQSHDCLQKYSAYYQVVLLLFVGGKRNCFIFVNEFKIPLMQLNGKFLRIPITCSENSASLIYKFSGEILTEKC